MLEGVIQPSSESPESDSEGVVSGGDSGCVRRRSVVSSAGATAGFVVSDICMPSRLAWTVSAASSVVLVALSTASASPSGLSTLNSSFFGALPFTRFWPGVLRNLQSPPFLSHSSSYANANTS